jgi:hypothetical protein
MRSLNRESLESVLAFYKHPDTSRFPSEIERVPSPRVRVPDDCQAPASVQGGLIWMPPTAAELRDEWI